VLQGAIDGGSDGWKNAWAASCEVEETQKRILRLQAVIDTSRPRVIVPKTVPTKEQTGPKEPVCLSC
jgi:hypothetical protein